MGYESRVYAMKRTERGGHVFGFELARFEVFAWSYSEMVDGWHGLFTAPIDYDLPDDGDGGAQVDCYGVECCAADVETVHRWLKAYILGRYCRDERAKAFYCWLDAIRGTEWADGLQLVEWGH